MSCSVSAILGLRFKHPAIAICDCGELSSRELWSTPESSRELWKGLDSSGESYDELWREL
eukprot:12967032-Alexandrium_andersonii.AAC.1